MVSKFKDFEASLAALTQSMDDMEMDIYQFKAFQSQNVDEIRV
jgi:hypothetical protein